MPGNIRTYDLLLTPPGMKCLIGIKKWQHYVQECFWKSLVLISKSLVIRQLV